ncbi:MAG: D-alanyl-D-alanine carboxypeptidase/D-alanyl-D-alanine endopeptidase [Armatimonadota bacterium]
MRALIRLSLLLLLAVSSGASTLSETVDRELARPALAHGVQGVLIKSLDTGRVYYEKNSDLLFIPASALKLVVSATALDALGPEYRWRTRILACGEVRDGVLHGDLALVGGGDPVLSREDLAAMVKTLGLRRVEGNVVGDDSRFDAVRLGVGWAWDDQPYYYAAQVSALNLNKNVVAVTVRGERGQASVRVDPPTAYVWVKNACTTGAGTVEVSRAQGRNTILVTGRIPEGETYEEKITVEEPALYAAQSLLEMLRRNGVEVTGQAVKGKATGRTLAEHLSPPLSEMLALLNKPSDNLIAECMAKSLGEGSTESGLAVERAFLKKIGVDMSGVGLVDGSGLSRRNLITPRNLVTLLAAMRGKKPFVDSLPIAGVDGLLKKRLKGTAAQGNARAKTGYLSRVSSVAGYVTTAGGDHLVFAILMNNHLCGNADAVAAQDDIVEALAGLSRP